MQITKKSIDILLSKPKQKKRGSLFYLLPQLRGRARAAEEERLEASWPAGWPGATIRFPPEGYFREIESMCAVGCAYDVIIETSQTGRHCVFSR